MKELVVKVIENEPLVAGVYKMKFSLPEKTEGLACGRFVNISTGDGGHLLRRPIAICEYTSDTVTICYQLKGEGTHVLSRVRPGDMLSCVLPLGNGFALRKEEKRVALIGGGVGVFPMVSVLKEYAGSGKDFSSYIGFRNKEAVCMEEVFRSLSSRCSIVTDDGSYGEKSNAVASFFKDYEEAKPDVVLSCGPVPMLRALKSGLQERNLHVPCFVSLEERMGCGIGACLVCVCHKKGGAENVRVCKDGPVFEIGEVEF
mgnify:FL=1